MLRDRRTWLAAGLVLAVAAVAALTLPAGSGAEAHEKAAMAKGNHFKCYPILDWTEWQPQGAALKDQFGRSEARAMTPKLLCNPVDKNGEGIVDKDDHLVCYQIHDDPSGSFQRVREVAVQNQFGQTQLWVGVPAETLCLPSMKRLIE